VPRSGAATPAINSSSVDFPQPFGPTTAVVAAGGNASVNSVNTRNPL
jgi:hypothetical protein